MQTVYKVFLVVFLLFIGFNLYGLDWDLGFMHTENTKYVFSIVAAIIGILLLFVLNTWSKLQPKK